MILRLLLTSVLLLVHGALHAEPSAAEKKGFAPRLLIYNAKGPTDSCGAGCDRWIAVEGEVDAGAASRIRRFLAEDRDSKRPIYFHSPGGMVEQSYVIARLLRGRKAVARVGRTVAKACAGGTQVDAACLKVKTAGGEVEAELTTRNAMCNSACSYLFFGATTREVAPDALVGVHSSRFTLVVRGNPPPGVVAEFRKSRMAKADRERAAFVTSMGISRDLDDLIKTVKFESVHALTRAELYRFGIDRRALVETRWTLEAAARPYIRKVAATKSADGDSFRIMEWRLFCENNQRARLMFVRESEQGTAGTSSVMMTAGADKSVAFGRYPARAGKLEVWSEAVAPDAMQAILAAPRLQMGERIQAAEGNANVVTFEIDTVGLGASWAQLLPSCPVGDSRPAASSNVYVAPAR